MHYKSTSMEYLSMHVSPSPIQVQYVLPKSHLLAMVVEVDTVLDY